MENSKLIEDINNVGEFEEKGRGVAPISFSDAVNRSKKKTKEIEDSLDKHEKEVLKDTDRMDSTDDSRFNHKVQKRPEYKKMHLSESLFEEYATNPIDEYLDSVRMGEGWVTLEKVEFDIEMDETLKGVDVDDIIDRACETGWKVKKLPDGFALVQKGVTVIDEDLNKKVEHSVDCVKDLLKDILKDKLKLKKDKITAVLDKVEKDSHFDGIYEIFLGKLALGDAGAAVEELKASDKLYVLDAYGPGYIKVAFKDEFDSNPFEQKESLKEDNRKDAQAVIKTALKRKMVESKKLTESIQQDSPEANGVAGMLNDLIIDEFETITAYGNAITTINSIDPESTIVDVLNDILKEENVHVGQLQAALTTISTSAADIAEGHQEGEEQLNEAPAEIPAEVTVEKSSFEDEHIG